MFGDAVEERLVEVGVFANVVADLQVVRIQMFQLAKRLLGDGFGLIGGVVVSVMVDLPELGATRGRPFLFAFRQN